MDSRPSQGARRWLRPERGWAHAMAVAAVASAVAIAARLALDPLLGPSAPLILLLIAPVLAALQSGFFAALVATVVCAVLGEALFIAPFGGFVPTSTSESVRLLIFLTEAMLFAWIIDSRRRALASQALASERAAREEARLRAVLEASASGLLLFDENGRVVMANAQAERMFGRTRDELTGLDAEALMPADARDLHAAQRAAYLAAPTPRIIGTGRDLTALRQDGTPFPVEVGLSPVREDGRTYVLASVVDITVRKRMESELVEAARHKDEFLAMLSHELRNPLSPLATGISLLERSGSLGPDERRTVEMLHRQARHLTHLVNDLLEVARVSRGKVTLVREPVVFQRTASHALDAVRDVVERRRLTVRVDVPDRPLVVDADPTRLRQVLENLLHNAAKFAREHGTIQIRATLEGQALSCCVHDDGIGLSAGDLGRLFKPFVQVRTTMDRGGAGLGLGLSVVRSLVEMHGGSVKASSPGPGQGATFCFTLPGARYEASPDPPAAAAAPAPAGAGWWVLVVDDNEDAAAGLADLLRLEGHHVAVAHDAPEALAAAHRRRFDVAFLDIGLPGIDGYELARRLREALGAAVPHLVALTGYGQPADKLRAAEAGFDRHLLKPADPAEVLELLAGPRPAAVRPVPASPG